MTTNKESFNLTPTEPDSVGNWDGQEQLAATNFNRIQNALYVAAPDDIELWAIHELMKTAWDHWGNDLKLLTVTDSQIDEYVAWWG